MLDFGFYNMDCLDGMRQFPDKFFDLAIVDPPYGIGFDKMQAEKAKDPRYGRAATVKTQYHSSGWDDQKPTKEYFDELFRVSKNQIIWGGNYFADFLPPSRCFVCWDKRVYLPQNDFADCEFAWGNEELGVARMFRFVWNGMLQGDMSHKENRIHPTQKPVRLYEWLLNQYAKEGYKLLDTHVGSASSLIAFQNAGYKYVGFEIDKVYYDLAKKRLEQETAQINITQFLRGEMNG